MDIKEILSRCDHTLLRQDATINEILTLCDEGAAYNVASVCIPACHVRAARVHAGDKLKICTVIGFPNGYSTTETKVFEADDAVKNGADEIDMVINISAVKGGDCAMALDEIMRLKSAIGGRVLKVIIETCLLTEKEKIAMCDIVSRSGADFIKTSTGFGAGGATMEDVALLRKLCPPHVKIKASGGISTLKDAGEFIALGADRLGSSRLVKLAAQAGFRPCP